jgi:hypothetical protein
MTAAIDEFWDQYFPEVPPVAHLFRNLLSDRWIRIDSLPDSKRYAESEGESQTILSRYNAVVDELATNRSIVLVTTTFSASRDPERDSALVDLDPGAEHWQTLPMHLLADDDPNDPNYWHLFASQRPWHSGALDQIFKLAADNAISNVFLLSPEDSWLFHPYDGGADIILSSVAQRDAFGQRYADWLSPRQDSL